MRLRSILAGALAALMLARVPAPCAAYQEPPKCGNSASLPWPPRVGRSSDEVQGALRDLEWSDLEIGSFRMSEWSKDFAKAHAADLEADMAALKTLTGATLPFEPEALGGQIFYGGKPVPGAAPSRPAGGVPERSFVFVSAGPEVKGKYPIERTWFSEYAPGAKAPEPRGLAVIMPGLYGSPEPVIEALVKSLRAEGWRVVRMLSQPSRFLQKDELTADVANPQACAEQCAHLLGTRSAECAYAVQGACEHVLAAHPELAAMPRVIIGMSGGAMTLPVVVAREPEKYAAAVLVAGGANLLGICIESKYAGWVEAVKVKWPGDKQDAACWSAMKECYLKCAKLDPYTTAEFLVGKPVMMVHGTKDTAVPAAYGELLWERLGKPERMLTGYEHETLFAVLPTTYPQLMEWLRTKTAKK